MRKMGELGLREPGEGTEERDKRTEVRAEERAEARGDGRTERAGFSGNEQERAGLSGNERERAGISGNKRGDGRTGKREPIPVKNRDIPMLSRVLYVMQAVSSTEQKRMRLQDRLWNMTQHITGLPGGGGEPKGLDATFAAIGETEEAYGQECAEWMAELKQAEDILNGIPSETMRVFVTMRYLLDMSRKEIMGQLNLKRWRYEEMCQAIEQAEDMGSVVWKERYILQKD